MDLSKLFTENYLVNNIYQNGRFLKMLLNDIIRFLSSPFEVGKQKTRFRKWGELNSFPPTFPHRTRAQQLNKVSS